MKNFIFSIIAGLILVSCQPLKEKEQVTIDLNNTLSPSGANASLPYLTMGGNDLLYMSWVEKRDSTWIDLKYSVLKGSEWQKPELIASGNDWFVNWADYPMMAVDKQGNMIAHFLAKSSAGTYSYDVNIVHKPVGGQWSKPIVPHNDGTPTEHGFVTMLPKNDGTFWLAWLDGRNTGGDSHDSLESDQGSGAMTIRTALIDMDGGLTNETELDNRVCDCCQTGGVMTSQGPVIIYRDRSETEVRDMSFVRQIENAWTKPSTVNADGWEIAGCPVNGPRMASFGNTTVSAWFTAAEGIPRVKVAFLNNETNSFNKPILIDDSSPVGRVDIVMLDDKSAFVSWLDLDNETPLIKFRKVHIDGTVGTPMVVSETSASRGSGFPQMEIVDGELYFAWTNTGDEETTISMKKFSGI